jgi:hypothetical protein
MLCVCAAFGSCRTSLCLTDRWETWEELYGVQVIPTTVGFSDAWDGDDTLVYEPESTAAFILSKRLCVFGKGGGGQDSHHGGALLAPPQTRGRLCPDERGCCREGSAPTSATVIRVTESQYDIGYVRLFRGMLPAVHTHTHLMWTVLRLGQSSHHWRGGGGAAGGDLI